MTAEALTFGERRGMDWNQMIDIVNNSVVASPLVGFKAQMLKDRNYAPAFWQRTSISPWIPGGLIVFLCP